MYKHFQDNLPRFVPTQKIKTKIIIVDQMKY